MRALVLSTLAVTATAIAITGLAQNHAADTTGLWSHRGTQNERVRPRIQLQPYGYPGYGAELATTTIVTDPASGQANPRMTLTVQPDGAAVWQTEQRQQAGPDCTRILTQIRTGLVKTEGGQQTLHIHGGSDRTVSTCVTPERAITSRQEAYGLHRNGRLLSLTGKGVTWTLSRG